MKKLTLNFTINVLMILCMSAIVGIGFLMKFILIPGQERWIKYERNVDLYFLGMDRHEWGTIHLIIGFILLGLLVLHIILHWSAISCMYNRLIPGKMVRIIIALLFIIISALLIFIAFFVNPEVVEIEQGKGRQVTNYTNNPKRENNVISSHEKKYSDNDSSFEKHNHSDLTLEVKGYMTLEEVSKKYNVPSEFIKIKLNIPKDISDKQKFGWLRKKYDFRMSEVEKIIIEYSEKKK